MSPQIQQGGLQDEDEGGKEVVLIPRGVGLAGKAKGVVQMSGRVSQPGEEEAGQACSDHTKGLVPSKAKRPTSAWDLKLLRFTISLLSADISETHW